MTITVEQILSVLPRRVRREVVRLLQKTKPDNDNMRAACRVLIKLLRPHEEALARIGLVVDYTGYALVFYTQRPGGNLNDWIAELQAEAEALADEVKRLERHTQHLKDLINTDPTKN